MNPADQCDHAPHQCVLDVTPVCAQLAGVEEVTIRSWNRRGWISRRGSQGRYATYCLHQVQAAEAREQRRARGYA